MWLYCIYRRLLIETLDDVRTLRAIYENNAQLCHDTVPLETVEHLLRMADSRDPDDTAAVFRCLQAMVNVNSFVRFEKLL